MPVHRRGTPCVCPFPDTPSCPKKGGDKPRPYTQLEREAAGLAEDVARLFIAKGLTLAVAESCTGGLIAHTLTNIAGSSKFFLAGLCVYSPEAKVSVLGVPQDLIDKHGVVSAAVAEEMAQRVRLLCGSSVGLATTGYAGPATGEEQLPVGTVFIAASTNETTISHQFHYDADRLGVKLAAAIDALRLLLDAAKDFDAVSVMRTIRDGLSQRYLKDPEAEDSDLQRIRQEYGIAPPARTTAKRI